MRKAQLAVLILFAACREAPVEPCSPTPLVVAQGAQPAARRSPFDSVFRAAGAEFHVPPALLAGLGWVETRWQMVEGTEEFPGRAPAFGVMALRGAALERGAALAGVPVEAARHDPIANIRAAAALLDWYAREAGIDRTRIEAWSVVVARYSGIELPEGRAAYARDVDRALARTAAGPSLAPPAAPGVCPPPPATGAPDYAPAAWRPSPNFDQRASDSTGAIHLVIITPAPCDWCFSCLARTGVYLARRANPSADTIARACAAVHD